MTPASAAAVVVCHGWASARMLGRNTISCSSAVHVLCPARMKKGIPQIKY
jgi:hypothetical protein